MTVAAQRAGLHFLLTWMIVKAWERVRPVPVSGFEGWSVADWAGELLRVVPHIPPAWLGRYVKWRTLKGLSPAFAEAEGTERGLLAAETMEWWPPEQWVEAWKAVFDPLGAWMEGRALREVAAIVAGVPIEGVPADRTQGKPIPKALAVVGETWSALALIAGGFLAVAEQMLESEVSPELASLPMCIKYGCDSPATLAWFRFGVRLRRPSRLLAMRFPPPRLENDEEMREWVRAVKRRWLSGSEAGHSRDPEDRVLEAIRTFTIG